MAGTTMTLPKRDRTHTYGDYLTWTDSQRTELIDGSAYVREPPAPGRLHQEIASELHGQALHALRNKPYRVYAAPFDVRLPKSTEEDDLVDTVVQPDVLIVSDLRKLDARGMRGAPDWVAEILSPCTASHDQIVKVPAYERARVPEVWLIHPFDRLLSIYQLEAGCYRRPTILELKGQTQIKTIPAVTIDWKRVLVRLA
jgi:Uma2 family endonuclease